MNIVTEGVLFSRSPFAIAFCNDTFLPEEGFFVGIGWDKLYRNLPCADIILQGKISSRSDFIHLWWISLKIHQEIVYFLRVLPQFLRNSPLPEGAELNELTLCVMN